MASAVRARVLRRGDDVLLLARVVEGGDDG